jgi:hypothetical protein
VRKLLAAQLRRGVWSGAWALQIFSKPGTLARQFYRVKEIPDPQRTECMRFTVIRSNAETDSAWRRQGNQGMQDFPDVPFYWRDANSGQTKLASAVVLVSSDNTKMLLGVIFSLNPAIDANCDIRLCAVIF